MPPGCSLQGFGPAGSDSTFAARSWYECTVSPRGKHHLWYTPDGFLRGRGADLLGWALLPTLSASFFVLAMLAVSAAELMEIIPLSPSQVGLLTAAFVVGGGLALWPAETATRRLGGRGLALGTLLAVMGSVVFALSDGFAGFVGGRLLQGLGAGWLAHGGAVLASGPVIPRRRRRVALLWASGAGVGVILAMLVLPAIQVAAGFRVVSLTTAGVVILFGTVALVHPAVRKAPDSSDPLVRIRTMGESLLGGTGAVFGLGAVSVVVSLVVWGPSFLQDQEGSSLTTAGYTMALVGVGLLVGTWAAGASPVRGRSLWVVLSLGVATILLSVMPVPGAGPAGTATYFCVLLLAGMAVSAAHLGALERKPGSPRSWWSSALPLVVFTVGAACGPWLFGLMAEKYGTGPRDFGYSAAFLVLTAFGLVGTVSFMARSILGENRRGRGLGSGEPTRK